MAILLRGVYTVDTTVSPSGGGGHILRDNARTDMIEVWMLEQLTGGNSVYRMVSQEPKAKGATYTTCRYLA